MGAIKAVEMYLLLGQSVKNRNHRRKTGHIYAVYLFQLEQFLQWATQTSHPVPFGTFSWTMFLFFPLGIDFSLHNFGYSNMTFDPQIRVSLNNLSQWDSSTQHYLIKGWGWRGVEGEEESSFFPWFHSRMLFYLISFHRNFVK